MQIRSAAALLLADVAVVAVAADADGAAASVPVPTVAAASAVSTSVLSLFIVPLLFTLSLGMRLLGRKDSQPRRLFLRSA
jgi:hypothetical protein